MVEFLQNVQINKFIKIRKVLNIHHKILLFCFMVLDLCLLIHMKVFFALYTEFTSLCYFLKTFSSVFVLAYEELPV